MAEPIKLKCANGALLIAPHPSGRARAWNDPRAPERLRAALAELEAELAPEGGS